MRFLKPSAPAKPVVAVSRRSNLGVIQRLLASFPLGARIRYHPEFDEASMLDSVLLGYGFDDQYVFVPQHLSIQSGDEGVSPSLKISNSLLPNGQIIFNTLESFHLIVPSDTGEERKLDYDRRAALGRTGQFSKGSRLSVITLGNGAENLRVLCEVLRREVLSCGPHRGLQVAVLSVQVSSVETYEPRAQSRIETRTPATVSLDGSDTVAPAFVLDVSEFFLRLSLDPPERTWPSLTAKSKVFIALKPWTNKPPLKLQCQYTREAGSERVFEISHVLKMGKYVNFTQLDGIELKIALMS